ncbi:hypothetical protein Bca52824_054076 [Brassica carinata]|uniref:Replication factor A C-terminal domain-containing protein n=1 Tax=Brassica carinata TaxID=52824 RepID=A0A8X7UMD0_BRACI|nr:hypothetical protein Bca52824_054076 [Brassica carinata]
MDLSGNSPASCYHKTSKKTVASSATAKSTGKSTASSAIVVKPAGKAAVSSANPMEPNAATDLSSMPGEQVMFFREVSLGPREAELMFRMIHFWEARNPHDDAHWTRDASYRRREDRFRFHTYEEFKANCDSKGDLYDYVSHMKLVNGQTMTDHIVLGEADIAEKRHLCVHVQTHDGPVMKLYLWDKAASDFCQKFKSYGSIPSVLLVTTVNPKHLGGTLALTSMSSSRVFMDADVQPSKDYLEWLVSNSEIANRVAAEVVTKPEAVVWLECTATIDDIVQGSAWYYISCGGCNSKAVKGPTSLICNNKKCGKSEVTGVPQYLTMISVYDKSEQALFVILGDAQKELTGKHAAELVANYFESNAGVGADHCVPVPEALLETIAPLPSTSDGILKTGGDDSGPSGGAGDSAGDRARKAAESLESDGAKRSKSG